MNADAAAAKSPLRTKYPRLAQYAAASENRRNTDKPDVGCKSKTNIGENSRTLTANTAVRFRSRAASAHTALQRLHTLKSCSARKQAPPSECRAAQHLCKPRYPQQLHAEIHIPQARKATRARSAHQAHKQGCLSPLRTGAHKFEGRFPNNRSGSYPPHILQQL